MKLKNKELQRTIGFSCGKTLVRPVIWSRSGGLLIVRSVSGLVDVTEGAPNSYLHGEHLSSMALLVHQQPGSSVLTFGLWLGPAWRDNDSSVAGRFGGWNMQPGAHILNPSMFLNKHLTAPAPSKGSPGWKPTDLERQDTLAELRSRYIP